MSKVQIDNSHFLAKVNLRLNHLPKNSTRPINVLDCFSGEGKIWKEIKKTNANINIISIDKKRISSTGLNLQGDNTKYLMTMDLNKYDGIDIDSYGIPYKQLKIVLQKKAENCIIFATAIQASFTCLPHGMLLELGYTKKMIQKIPTLIAKNWWIKIKEYLAMYGIKKIWVKNTNGKYYFCFKKES